MRALVNYPALCPDDEETSAFGPKTSAPFIAPLQTEAWFHGSNWWPESLMNSEVPPRSNRHTGEREGQRERQTAALPATRAGVRTAKGGRWGRDWWLRWFYWQQAAWLRETSCFFFNQQPLLINIYELLRRHSWWCGFISFALLLIDLAGHRVAADSKRDWFYQDPQNFTIFEMKRVTLLYFSSPEAVAKSSWLTLSKSFFCFLSSYSPWRSLFTISLSIFILLKAVSKFWKIKSRHSHSLLFKVASVKFCYWSCTCSLALLLCCS